MGKKYVTITEFAESRGKDRGTVNAFIRKHPEIDRYCKRDGKDKIIEVDSYGYILLDEKYALPKVVEDTEAMKKLIEAQKQIIQLQAQVNEAVKVVAQAETIKLLLEDKEQQLSDAEERIKSKNDEISKLHNELNEMKAEEEKMRNMGFFEFRRWKRNS